MNAELHRKVDELDRANSDLRNLLDSTQIATIFLDAELHIANFTPAISAVVPLRPSDLGRPLADLAQRFVDVDLVGEARDVLRTLGWRERSLRTTAGDRRYLLRLGPYRTVANVIDGVVLTFTDVTALQQAEEAAHAAQVYAESIVATVRTPCWSSIRPCVCARRIGRSTTSFVTSAETEGRLLSAVGIGAWDIPALRRRLAEVLAQHQAFEDFEVDHDFPTIGPRRCSECSRDSQRGARHDAASAGHRGYHRAQAGRAGAGAGAGRPRTARPGSAPPSWSCCRTSRVPPTRPPAVRRLCSMPWTASVPLRAGRWATRIWRWRRGAVRGRQYPSGIWTLLSASRAFQQATQSSEFAAGEGLIGRVGASAQPAWSVEVATDLAGPRQRAALEAGLSAGVAVPILVGPEVVGVLEFYAAAPLAPAPALRDALVQMGIQLGRAVERERAATQAQHQQEALVQHEKLAVMGSLLASVAHEPTIRWPSL